MRFNSWLGRGVYYCVFAVGITAVSVVTVLAKNDFALSSLPGFGQATEASQPLAVAAEPQVQSANIDSSPPDFSPVHNFYIDENGNWIAGTPPPKPTPEPQTSSWCGEIKRKKWRDNRCEIVHCLDGDSGPRPDSTVWCDPCRGGLAQMVCAHLDSQNRSEL